VRPPRLLRTLINAATYDRKTLSYQTTIHVAFLVSAMAMAIASEDRTSPERSSRAT